ncbi:alpha/beta hydrolase family protein [Risungbinella massiliensis]|uniref:alpha/beta hydrolase family protein n=1 Tax=Risungbinella massiliensis TaxID=1329796 RepID=UPI001E320012|nr:alpha/beta fold hydrolase [Risungbinella massiliensis]
MKKPLKYSIYSITSILVIFSICMAIYLPVFQLPKPSGPYQVGTQTFHMIDPNRDEIWTKASHDKRELMVQIWYPAQNSKDNKPKALFPEDTTTFQKFTQAYANGLGVPSFVLDYWKYIKSNSYEGVDVLSSKTPYPVVLLSHGFGTTRILHTSQAEHLASNGFIVIAIDHTYSTTATVFPDGRVTGLQTEMNLDSFFETNSKLGMVWTEDIGFIINQLEKMQSGIVQSKFQGKLDLQNLGIMGHSVGGATAFNALYLNSKIKAGINMDGTLYDRDDRNNISKPFMFIQAEDFMVQRKKMESGNIPTAERKTMNISDEQFNRLKQEKLKEYQIIDNVVKHGGLMISVKGAAHFNFTDLQLFSDLFSLLGMTGDIDGERSAMIVNQYVLDFFNKHLKGTGGDLIKEPNTKYPEVIFP